jgi:alkyl sulfatase BDS1-like metallo-beta-lactamase superfamily hydrolase
MGEVLDLAERFWRGEIPRRDLWRPTGRHEELAPGLVFFHTWANVTALRTEAGLVLVDTGNFAARDRTFAAVRAVDPAPLAAAVYTHGHVDHACGLPPFLAEAREKGRPEPAIVAHRNVAARFDRYRMTAPWNGLINSRQFSVAATWPTEYQYPGTVYDTTHVLEIGDVRLELTHARGETDDHTWLWWPARRILFTGDLFFWVAPNAGNPQKVQRYAAEWARALRAMAERGAELLIPGHGAPVVGVARVHQALSDTALWLETLVNETVKRMNAGLALEDILAEVKPPAHLSERPYLQAVYDEPDYVIRNIWRLYGGWWDGQPAHLKPAREAEIGLEVAALAGGIDAVVARARALAAEGRLALASHLIDWVAAAAPNNWAVHDARADIYLARAQNSEALMTRGIFSEAARESAIKAGRPVTEAGAGQPSTKPAPPGDPERRQADSR